MYSITLAGLIDEDFINYKVPSMTLMFPYCDFKCNKDCGENVCQNIELKDSSLLKTPVSELCNRYLSNNITKAIVMQGLEPLDSFNELIEFINEIRQQCDDDIVIYTGYNKDEILEKIKLLRSFSNIIIKFGRFIPHQSPHYDSVLQVNLASDNQYAERIN